MSPAADRALQFLASGLVDLARRQVDRALAESPDSAHVHHVSALVARTEGRPDAALAALGRAIALDPTSPAPLVDRANHWLGAGRIPEALADARRAHDLRPGHPAVKTTLGQALQALGEGEEARRILAEALVLAPDHGPARHNLGRVLLDLNRPEDALEVLAPLAGSTASVDVLADLARCLRAVERPNDAVAPLERALALAPDRPDLADALGGALLAAGREGARPLAEATARFRATLARWPDRAETWANLSAALIEERDTRGAVAAADRALVLDPEDAGARMNRSFALCLEGAYEPGLEDYRHRWRTDEFRRAYRPIDRPEWDGASLPGGVLVARGEQGLGDQIMAARFLPWARERVGRLVFECHPSLHRLMARSFPGVDLVDPGAIPDAAAAWVGAMDLARITGTRVDHMPMPVPYLRASPPPDLPAGTAGRRVALVWSGKTRPRDRSCPLAPLVALCRRAGWVPHALQVGPRRTDLASLPEDQTPLDLSMAVTDMADTAALLGAMDLLISVDTAVAHLAGALGRPGFVLLLATPDWRWGAEGARSIWYPTLELIRQPTLGDWPGAFEILERALASVPRRG
jgi:tetratricopeptide (TPR) repeat protein